MSNNYQTLFCKNLWQILKVNQNNFLLTMVPAGGIKIKSRSLDPVPLYCFMLFQSKQDRLSNGKVNRPTTWPANCPTTWPTMWPATWPTTWPASWPTMWPATCYPPTWSWSSAGPTWSDCFPCHGPPLLHGMGQVKWSSSCHPPVLTFVIPNF